MSIPTFTGLNTALSGLQAYQTAINETGQNIANASTPGYSRQRVNLTESNALSMPAMSNVSGLGGQLGTGVDISSISRIRNQFLDIQYRAQNATSSAATQASTDLTSAQSAVTSQDISTQLQSFWTAWGAVANTPSGNGGAAALETLVGTASTLAQTFKSVNTQLSNLQTAATSQLATLMAPTGQVQTDVNQIATLNGQIAQSMALGQTPNDLLDQRDQALDDLSGFGALTVTNQPNGTVNVGFNILVPSSTTPTTLTPFSLVSGTTATDLGTLPTGTQVSGGQLGALYDDASPTGPIGSLMTTPPGATSPSLDSVASTLINSVNNLLLPSNGLGPPASTPFFSGTSASTIAVAATGASIQAWLSGNSGGGAAVASQIAALQGGSADQSYSSFVGQVGSAVKSAQSASMTGTSLVSSIDSQRQSVSGVSLDEEMTNLISFQQGYQASARVMSTIDAMLNTLINQTGVA